MHRRSLLRGGVVAIASTAGCTAVLPDVRVERGGGSLHRPSEPLVEGGVAASPERSYHAALVTRREGTDIFVGPPDDPVMERVAEADFSRQFLIAVEARRPADEAVSIRFLPGDVARTGLRQIRATAVVEPWGTPLPEEVRGADELVFTAVFLFSRPPAFVPRRARIELVDPDGRSVATLDAR